MKRFQTFTLLLAFLTIVVFAGNSCINTLAKFGDYLQKEVEKAKKVEAKKKKEEHRTNWMLKELRHTYPYGCIQLYDGKEHIYALHRDKDDKKRSDRYHYFDENGQKYFYYSENTHNRFDRILGNRYCIPLLKKRYKKLFPK